MAAVSRGLARLVVFAALLVSVVDATGKPYYDKQPVPIYANKARTLRESQPCYNPLFHPSFLGHCGWCGARR